MASFEVLFFGVRGSCPVSAKDFIKFGGNTSCTLVGFGENPYENLVVFDIGTGFKALGNFLSKTPANLNFPRALNCFVSHYHWDHIQGLPFIAQADQEGFSIKIFGPIVKGSGPEPIFKKIMREPYFPVGPDDLRAKVSFFDLEDPGRLFLNDALIEFSEVSHLGVKTLGYRLTYLGKSLCFVSDYQAPRNWRDAKTENSLINLVKDVDLLIFDSQYSDEEFEAKYSWGHSPSSYSVKIAIEANVKKLVLYHHDPFYNDDYLADLFLRTKAFGENSGYSGEIEIASEGMAITLL